MAAIITSEFRKNSRRVFINDITNTEDYFVGLGKTDSWPSLSDADNNEISEYNRKFSAPLPTDTIVNKIDVLKNLMVLVRSKNAEVFTVIPRNNWVHDRIYKRYDPTDPKSFDYETIDGEAHYPCYVTSNDRVYMCLANTDADGQISPSAAPIPSGSGAPELSYHAPSKIHNGDNYIWAYVTNLDEDSKFYTDQFVNYTYPSEGGDHTDIKNSTGGMVYGFKVINGGGSGITEATELELSLVGTTRDTENQLVPRLTTYGAITTDINIIDDFNVIYGANGVERIEYPEPLQAGGIPAWKMGFESASVLARVNGQINTDIHIIPYVLPYEGIGRYPDNDLPSFYTGIAVDFIGAVDGEAPVGYNVDVRQISIVKNPERNPDVTASTDNDQDVDQGFYANDEAYDALKYITLPDIQKDYIGRDFIIEQESTGAKAWLDYVDNVNERLYYHQNSSELVNFKRFSTESIASVKITSLAGFWDELYYRCDSVTDPEYLPDTGEVIFYENRKPINRNYNQTDEVKLVIQF
jgi:hypothetical protein